MPQDPPVMVEQAVQPCIHLHQCLWHTHSEKVSSQRSCRQTLDIKRKKNISTHFTFHLIQVNELEVGYAIGICAVLKGKIHPERLSIFIINT